MRFASLCLVILLIFTSAFAGKPSTPPPDPVIVFENGPLQLITADGSYTRNLISDNNWNRSPNWSPDGTKVVFTSLNATTRESGVFIVNKDGTGLCKVVSTNANANGYILHPVWSPQPIGGKYWIIYSDFPVPNDIGDLYITEATCNSTNTYNLTNTPDVGEGMASWSSDGVSVAITIGWDNAYKTGIQQYTQINELVPILDAGNVIGFSFYPSATKSFSVPYCFAADWSRSGTGPERLLATCSQTATVGSKYSLYIGPTDGGPATALNPSAWDFQRFGSWSPDNSYISFSGRLQGSRKVGVYKMNVSTGAVTTLLTAPASNLTYPIQTDWRKAP